MNRLNVIRGFVGAVVASCMLFAGSGVVFCQEEAELGVGTVIRPSAVRIAKPQVVNWDWEKMAEFAATNPQAEPEYLPRLSDLDADKYSQMKAAADAQAAAAAGKPAIAAADEAPLAPPLLRGVSFPGPSQSGGFPPDTHGAVNQTQFVAIVNFQVQVFNKTTGALLKNTALNSFFFSTEFVFDPRIVYDQTWNRWVAVATRKAAATDTVRRFFIAISTTSDATGSWTVYHVPFAGSTGDWFDYPQLGMNQDAVFITANVFGAAGFRYAAMVPLAKARIYNALSVPVRTFTGLRATLAPPIVLDMNADSYFVTANLLTHLHLYRGNNLSTAEATMVLQSAIDVPDFAVPPSAPQLGTTQTIDTLDRRFVNASTQIGDSLFNVHTIRLSGFAAPKWYEIDTDIGANPAIKQSGFFFESSTSHDFNASIAANTSREVFVNWNSTDVTNANTSLRHNAFVRISGRQAADAAGVITKGSAVAGSAAALTGNPSGTAGVQRWGDYSAVSLDPSAGTTTGCTGNRRAYGINERINSASAWGSRIFRFGFCD